MAKNDTFLLDGVIDQRIASRVPSADRGEAFELFALEQLLKDYDLSRDELETGWVDGSNDGGVDGFYIFVNGHLVSDASSFVWPRQHAKLDIWLITAKHHDTFLQAPLDSLVATIQELFELSTEDSALRGSYSPALLARRSALRDTYRKVASAQPSTTFHFAYASRGDANQVGESVRARAQQIQHITRELFSSSVASFRFMGAAELIATSRKLKNFSLTLPTIEHLSHGRENYILLVRLSDYYRFVTDDQGALRRYLFDSNVRDYLGDNQVNDNIAETLESADGPDFWWLNNGITIIATSAHMFGKDAQMSDVQIVNGLQTTENIYAHFSGQATIPSIDERGLMVKVITSRDVAVRDKVISATNSQSVVEGAALRATDEVQRDIEDALERRDWYYERRKNYYRNVGKPEARFVTPLFIASAHVALVMKNPAQASRLKSKFMRSEESYRKVFSKKTPIAIWPRLVDIVKTTEFALAALKGGGQGQGERFFATWRSPIAFMAVARRLGTFEYSQTDLLAFDATVVTTAIVEEIWAVVRSTFDTTKRIDKDVLVSRAIAAVTEAFGIQGREVLAKRSLGVVDNYREQRRDRSILPEFVDAVDRLLPEQPWRIGVHLEVAKALKCAPFDVSTAIRRLMDNGRRKRQKDGVVYDPAGNIVAVDPDRPRGT